MFLITLICLKHFTLDPGSGLLPILGLLLHRNLAVRVDLFDAEVMEHIIGVSTGLAIVQ